MLMQMEWQDGKETKYQTRRCLRVEWSDKNVKNFFISLDGFSFGFAVQCNIFRERDGQVAEEKMFSVKLSLNYNDFSF